MYVCNGLLENIVISFPFAFLLSNSMIERANKNISNFVLNATGCATHSTFNHFTDLQRN